MGKKVIIDETMYRQLKHDLRKSIATYFKFWFLSMILNSIVALTFYYIEHCLEPVPRSLTRSEKNWLKTCDLINNTRYNESTLLKKYLFTICDQEVGDIQSTQKRNCELTISVFSEWFSFAYVVSVTIGKLNILSGEIWYQKYVVKVLKKFIKTSLALNQI